MGKKIFKTSDIVREVKIVLDENDDSAPLLVSGDVNQLKTDEIIEHLIAAAIDRIVAQSSLDKVIGMAVDEEGENLDWDPVSDEYCVSAVLPENMARLVYVRLKSWKRGVSDIINDTDDKYLEYRSDFAGIRPDVLSPGVATMPGIGGRIVIECYPKGDTDGAIIKYIPLAESGYYNEDGTLAELDEYGNPITAEGAVSDGWAITDQIERAVVYMVANLYYVTLGDGNRAELMASQVRDILGIYNQQAEQ